MSKKEIAIVFGITSNLTFALANVILGLKKYSPDFADEIIVYHDNISEKDQELMNNILPCRFIKYEFPIKDTSIFDEGLFNQFSCMAYSRFECFNLLKEFKKVVWLDVDILIQKDISGLLDYASTGIGILPGGLMKDNFKEKIEEFNLLKIGYWTGTIIFTDDLPDYEKLSDWCYENLKKYASVLYLPDQGIMNILIQKFNLTPMEINKEKYCAHPIREAHKTAVIVHSYRPKKFWDCWKFKEWDENYKNWTNMGGSPYAGKKCSSFLRYIERKFPGSPNPLRKPRAFVKFYWETTFNSPYSKQAKELEKVKAEMLESEKNKQV